MWFFSVNGSGYGAIALLDDLVLCVNISNIKVDWSRHVLTWCIRNEMCVLRLAETARQNQAKMTFLPQQVID